ncbi:MAG: hypothetical protein EOP04_17560 [Proteobacteria bacterium]|nr:MAG: hypothetical protein EOP04_17560 [Pseudomonadota bacterium]
MLLELKKEGLPLTEEDASQGLSYARLTHPMPPITLVSNGTDNKFYNTYTKEKLTNETVDLEFIQKLTDNSFLLALNDFKEAVNVLLNKEPAVFSKVINQLTEAKFQRLVGEVEEFAKPIQ